MSLFSGGCSLGKGFINSFKGQPGQKITLPYREPVGFGNYTVAVRMSTGSWQPMCMPPDAANDIDCTFYYSWFENIPMDPDGYRYLTFPLAREACDVATWAISSGPSGLPVVEACARALMFYRWMEEDPDIFKEEVY
jgi:hypothetical protein